MTSAAGTPCKWRNGGGGELSGLEGDVPYTSPSDVARSLRAIATQKAPGAFPIIHSGISD